VVSPWGRDNVGRKNGRIEVRQEQKVVPSQHEEDRSSSSLSPGADTERPRECPFREFYEGLESRNKKLNR